MNLLVWGIKWKSAHFFPINSPLGQYMYFGHKWLPLKINNLPIYIKSRGIYNAFLNTLRIQSNCSSSDAKRQHLLGNFGFFWWESVQVSNVLCASYKFIQRQKNQTTENLQITSEISKAINFYLVFTEVYSTVWDCMQSNSRIILKYTRERSEFCWGPACIYPVLRAPFAELNPAGLSSAQYQRHHITKLLG